ncbi:FAD-dependent oxidoreductase [uncultured Gimesia sp.]|uniref:FAD-dependent oxidoreductase n=1 Tax=uncultured Gimesia sp. TaxID=1678688 RepID=UPI002628781B|nr:FAD-dependent oxidoreductase [uncultured Gimesia sp.]
MSNKNMDRRKFGKYLAGSTAGLMTGANIASAKDPVADGITRPSNTMLLDGGGQSVWNSTAQHVRTNGWISPDGKVFHEAARNIPIVEEDEVIVCGGGPAGVAAALASARSGAKTRLLEVNGCVGGVWTAGALTLIIDAQNKPGIMREILNQLEERNASNTLPNGSVAFDTEKTKLLLEDLLLEAGVKIQLHTRVVGAVTDINNRLSVIVTESKSGRQAWRAKSFIDCSGDGDLAAQAGCGYEFGQPGTGLTQPMSLMVLLTGVTTDGIAQFIRGDAEPRKLGNPKKNLLAEFKRAGVDPSYGGPTIFRVRDGLYAMMANHEYGTLSIDAAHVTDATLQARREVHKLVNSLRKLGGPWTNLEIVATGEHIGTREGRRIRGRYHVTSEDLKNGTRFDDAICHVRFGIDVHSTNPDKTKAIEKKPFKSKPYDIPLRALIARDVSGLMMAGRCISGDFIAHSSYRVTGNAVAMGEAAGVASAIAAKTEKLPHEVPFSSVSKQLDQIRSGMTQQVKS